jgi:hypothetical protein
MAITIDIFVPTKLADEGITVEIRGDIAARFPLNASAPLAPLTHLLAFSDGTVLGIELNDAGTWEISLLSEGSAAVTIYAADEAQNGPRADRAILRGGDVRWIVRGVEWMGKVPR